MQTLTAETPIIKKTKELCQTILDQPDFQQLRGRVDAFLENEQAKTQYQLVNEQGEALHHKQHQGLQLSPQEITEFEKHREALFNNPVARDFLDAQQEMQKVQEAIVQYVSKTLELGRVPQADDFDSGSCGHGCGCSH